MLMVKVLNQDADNRISKVDDQVQVIYQLKMHSCNQVSQGKRSLN